MKISKIFLKGLIGIPVGIFTLELFNIIFSMKYGQYIRLDCIENGIYLNNVLNSYLFCSFSSYTFAVCMYISAEINKEEIPVQEKAKKNNKITIPLMVGLLLIMILLIVRNPNTIFGFIPSVIWSGIAMMVEAIRCLLDRYTIKEINKKLREK